MQGPLDRTLAMILAGGQGERLYPLTRDRAKPAVPFGGLYRIIDFTLSNCLNSGLRRVNVLTQYKSISLDRHLRLSWDVLNPELGEYINVIPPQQRTVSRWYRGTADAIYQNIYTLERARPERTFVLSGDHVYKMDYTRMLDCHIEKNADLTVACIPVDRDKASQLGVVEVDSDGRIVGFDEKPAEPKEIPGVPGRCLASMGVYLFNTDTLVREVSGDARRQTSHDFGRDVIPSMIRTKRVYVYGFADEEGRAPYWRDIGLLDAYWEANMDLVSVKPELDLYEPGWPIRTYHEQMPPAKTVHDEDERRGEAINSLVCSGCIISGGHVESSILSPRVRVNSYATVTGSVLMDGVEVGRGAEVSRAIIDKDVKIPEGEKIGVDLDLDRARFVVTNSGIVAVQKEMPSERFAWGRGVSGGGSAPRK